MKITPVSPEDIAEAIAATSPAREELHNGTIRDTNTAYEDRTHNPAREDDVEYDVVTSELDGGSILTTFMDPVGGFSEAE